MSDDDERLILAELTPLAQLRLSDWNPRSITEAQLESLCRAITADPGFLWHRPILAMADGTIYAGHQRYKAVQKLGWATVPAVVHDVPIGLAQERALRDNNQWGDWQLSDLATILAKIPDAPRADLGFDKRELDRVLAQLACAGPQTPDPGAHELRAQELQAKWQTRPGQLWVAPSKTAPPYLHTIVCGDSGDRNVVEWAFSYTPNPPRLEFSDPPYEISTNSGGVMGESGHLNRIAEAAIDTMDPADLLEVAPTTVFCCNRPMLPAYIALAAAWGVPWDICIWRKSNTPPNYAGHLQTDLEWLFILGDQSPLPGLAPALYSKLYQSEVVSGGERFVGWQKPVALIQKFILLFTYAGQTVLDRYLGTGSTIVAAEQNCRLGVGIEREPRYVAVALQRLAEMGLAPYLAAGDSGLEDTPEEEASHAE